MNKAFRFGVVAAAAAAATSAHAALDVSPVTTALADAITAVSTVGAAALGVYVAAKVFKMIKSAM